MPGIPCPCLPCIQSRMSCRSLWTHETIWWGRKGPGWLHMSIEPLWVGRVLSPLNTRQVSPFSLFPLLWSHDLLASTPWSVRRCVVWSSWRCCNWCRFGFAANDVVGQPPLVSPPHTQQPARDLDPAPKPHVDLARAQSRLYYQIQTTLWRRRRARYLSVLLFEWLHFNAILLI